MALANLTLSSVFEHPQRVTFPMRLDGGEAFMLRPLRHDDVDGLADFLAGLSAQTRRFSIFVSYDRAMAQAMCDAINRYDKLRFVMEVAQRKEIAALLEFSFDLPEGDLLRYAHYRVALDAATDCRFGPTLADVYQNRGLGSRVFPYLVQVARGFGKQRMILWGGVLADNLRAIHFYEKVGFRRVGSFQGDDEQVTIDMLLVFDART